MDTAGAGRRGGAEERRVKKGYCGLGVGAAEGLNLEYLKTFLISIG
jgi:hypothetical protein